MGCYFSEECDVVCTCEGNQTFNCVYRIGLVISLTIQFLRLKGLRQTDQQFKNTHSRQLSEVHQLDQEDLWSIVHLERTAGLVDT